MLLRCFRTCCGCLALALLRTQPLGPALHTWLPGSGPCARFGRHTATLLRLRHWHCRGVLLPDQTRLPAHHGHGVRVPHHFHAASSCGGTGEGAAAARSSPRPMPSAQRPTQRLALCRVRSKRLVGIKNIDGEDPPDLLLGGKALLHLKPSMPFAPGTRCVLRTHVLPATAGLAVPTTNPDVDPPPGLRWLHPQCMRWRCMWTHRLPSQCLAASSGGRAPRRWPRTRPCSTVGHLFSFVGCFLGGRWPAAACRT